MRIILADLNSSTINGVRTGHYFALAKNYQEVFGDDCKIAGGPIYKSAFKEEDLVLLPYNIASTETGIRQRLKTFANARSLFKQGKGGCIVLQQCAVITTFICLLLFYHRTSKVYLIQYSLDGFRVRIGEILYSLVKHKIDGVLCPNDEVGKAFGVSYCVVPDYIYSKNYLEEGNRIPYSKKIYDIGIVGRIAPGKGIVESALKLANTKYKVVIAGRPQSKELEDDLKNACQNADNIELRLGFIKTEDYNILLSQSRYALLNYQDEYSKRSSGVVYDMLFAGIPVVGCKCSALDFIEEKGMGVLYDNLEEFDIDSIWDETRYDLYIDNIKKYCAAHAKYKHELREFLLSD